MPVLNWIGKNKVVNHHRQVPLRAIEAQWTHGDPGDNLIIQGDNLDALKALLPRYEGQVDVVYIDPPYNTGNENWVYNDNVNDPRIQRWLGQVVGKEGEDLSRHDKWLCMMYPRLKLLHQLLAPSGVIFISIDDNEQANLKLICDEIFGSNNLVATFVWEKTQHFGRQSINTYSNYEFILAYAKEKYYQGTLKRLLVETIKSELEDAPLYNASNNEQILTFPAGSVRFNIPDRTYTQTSKPEKYLLLEPVTVRDSVNADQLTLRMKSRWSNDTVQKEIARGVRFWIKTEAFAVRTIYPSDRMSFQSAREIILTQEGSSRAAFSEHGVKVGTTENGSNEVRSIFQQDAFPYAKPQSLIQYLISLAYSETEGKKKTDLLVLDSFAGSGTTAHAVLNLNKADGGNRRFILCEMMDYAESLTAERVKRVIDGYGQGAKAVEGTGGGFTFCRLGDVLVTEQGLNSGAPWAAQAALLWRAETGKAWPKRPEGPLLGVCDGLGVGWVPCLDADTAVALKSEHRGPIVVYGDQCLLSAQTLQALDLTFKKLPRDLVVR